MMKIATREIFLRMFERQIWLVISAALIISCVPVFAQTNMHTTASKTHIPTNLTECIEELKITLPKTVIDRFKSEPEDITYDYDLTLGMWIRNTWIHGKWSSALPSYFKNLGIENAEDMSGIILTSLWRDLHSQPLRLDEQVHKYQQYWFYNAAQVTEREQSQKPSGTRYYQYMEVEPLS